MSTVQLQSIDPQATSEMAAAERLYLFDLPSLLKNKSGLWVVYTAEGCVAEGEDELALFQQCSRNGLQRGQFLVARVEPDPAPAEITETWFPRENPRDEVVSEKS